MQNSMKKLKKKSEIQLFNRENVLAIFDDKIEIRERRCLLASRFLVFFFFGVVLARSFFPSFRLWIPKAVQRSALCRSWRELSNAYLLAKFRFDTAENEPYFVSMQPLERALAAAGDGRPRRTTPGGRFGAPRRLASQAAGDAGSIGRILQGSFSAVSKRIFASEYSFESSRRDLHNALLCTALQFQILVKNIDKNVCQI